MKVLKTFNNNIALVEDSFRQEMILMGKGIAFGLKKGDSIDSSKIEKKFVFDTRELNDKFTALFNQVPVKYIDLSSNIIDYASKELNITFDNNIYLALSDHISYAIERYQNNEQLKNALLFDIKKFYPNEFKVALKALDMIRYETDIIMSEDEAGFIAMHFVNASQSGEAMSQTIAITKIVDDILQIVEYHYHLKLDENSINYIRFVTHIRYFARRLFTDDISNDGQDDDLFEQIRNKYKTSYECCLKVKKYILINYHRELGNDEMVYFMLHINRVCSRQI